MRRASPRGWVLGALVLGGAMWACGGGGGTPDWLPSDIDEQATIDAIGAAGYQKLCSAFEGYVLDQYRDSYLVEAVCTAVAIEQTQTASACGDFVDDCKSNPPAEATALLDSILGQAGCGGVAVSSDGCLATVAQVKQCFDELGEEVGDLRFTLTCAAAGQPLDDGWWQIATPASCSTLEASC